MLSLMISMTTMEYFNSCGLLAWSLIKHTSCWMFSVTTSPSRIRLQCDKIMDIASTEAGNIDSYSIFTSFASSKNKVMKRLHVSFESKTQAIVRSFWSTWVAMKIKQSYHVLNARVQIHHTHVDIWFCKFI